MNWMRGFSWAELFWTVFAVFAGGAVGAWICDQPASMILRSAAVCGMIAATVVIWHQWSHAHHLNRTLRKLTREQMARAESALADMEREEHSKKHAAGDSIHAERVSA
jgi:uncharacterized membrane protein YfcA